MTVPLLMIDYLEPWTLDPHTLRDAGWTLSSHYSHTVERCAPKNTQTRSTALKARVGNQGCCVTKDPVDKAVRRANEIENYFQAPCFEISSANAVGIAIAIAVDRWCRVLSRFN